MYLISIYFDEKTEQAMQAYINQIAKATGNSFMLDGSIPPHITLLGFQAKDESKVIELLDKHIDEIMSGYIYFAAIGEFKGQVIYAHPILNEYLSKLFEQVYNIYKENNDITFSKFYIPNNWIPHMSIGKHLDEEQIIEAFKVLVKQFVPMEATVARIGIAKTNPHRDIKIYDLKRYEQ